MEGPIISAVTYDKNQTKFSIIGVPDVPGVAAKVFNELAKHGINVDLIVQSAAREGCNDISFTVEHSSLKKTLYLLRKVRVKLNAEGVIYDNRIAKISIVGVGMRSHPGVAAKMFTALAKQKINIEMISTSEIIISCIIKQRQVRKAVKILHSSFGLNK